MAQHRVSAKQRLDLVKQALEQYKLDSINVQNPVSEYGPALIGRIDRAVYSPMIPASKEKLG